MLKIAFIDLEIGSQGRILDIGGVKSGQMFHSAMIPEFVDFIADCGLTCKVPWEVTQRLCIA
jgi:hypothetical protein